MHNSNQLLVTINLLLSVLFKREEANYQKRRLQMIDRNVALGGSADGFRHMGVIYSRLDRGRSQGTYSAVHHSLVLEMNDIDREYKLMLYEQDRIRQAFVLALRDCRSFQDIRDALPNSVKEFIPECRRLERTRPEAFTLADNPRAYRQYMKLREKIDFYVAAQLLY